MEEDRIKENRFANQIDAESLHEFFGRDNELYK